MNIVVLEGSPNKNGSSNLLAEQFIRGATEAGHSVQAVDVAHANHVFHRSGRDGAGDPYRVLHGLRHCGGVGGSYLIQGQAVFQF